MAGPPVPLATEVSRVSSVTGSNTLEAVAGGAMSVIDEALNLLNYDATQVGCSAAAQQGCFLPASHRGVFFFFPEAVWVDTQHTVALPHCAPLLAFESATSHAP